jgi:type II secretory pathway pseudopilin PulG
MPTKNTGFTIIETLIVLVMATIILLAVLIAVPHLRRNMRDNQRKQYAASILASIDQYYTNNASYPNFNDPAQKNTFLNKYVRVEEDPYTGANYNAILWSSSESDHSAVPEVGEVIISHSHWCNRYGDGDHPDDTIAAPAHGAVFDFVILVGTEIGDYYCVDKHDAALD